MKALGCGISVELWGGLGFVRVEGSRVKGFEFGVLSLVRV
jgi:hypothetical protein